MEQAKTCAKLMSLGVPKETASNIIVILDRWVTNNGIEWTIDHLKDMKQVFICNLAHVPCQTKTWVKRRPDGFPAGPILSTFLKGKLSSSRKVSRALTVLSSYSMYIAPQCTEKQLDKFFGSMCSKDKTGLNSRLKHFWTIHTKRDPYKELEPFMAQCVSSGKRAPGDSLRTVPEDQYLKVLQHSIESASVWSVVMKYPEISSKVLPIDDYNFRVMQNYKHHLYVIDPRLTDNFGVISGIQEPGFKLRAVANPDRVIQAMLEPLKNLVMDHLKTLPTDHTHDQLGAVPKIQNMLRSGQSVHSVDLSDATNLFPLPLQVDLLKKMCPPSYEPFIRLFEEVSSGNWLTKLRGKPEIVNFTRGQPLGLGPSFGTFALAHNVLLTGLCYKLRISPVDNFVVLGDDVVVKGGELNRLYRATLTNLGCKVSESKTLSSHHLAEFAGCVITADLVAKGYKWRDVSDVSFLDMVKNLGPKAQGFLHPWQRDVVKLLRHVPVDLGGLGWSDSLTLEQALELPASRVLLAHICSSDDDKLMLFRDLIPDATRVIYALQEEYFLPYYAVKYPTPLRGSGVSSVWPAEMFIKADDERSRGVIRPSSIVMMRDDPRTSSYARAFRNRGDLRPSSLSLISLLMFDPQTNSLVSKSIENRIKSKKASTTHKFSVVVEPVSKPVQDVRSAQEKDKGTQKGLVM